MTKRPSPTLGSRPDGLSIAPLLIAAAVLVAPIGLSLQGAAAGAPPAKAKAKATPVPTAAVTPAPGKPEQPKAAPTEPPNDQDAIATPGPDDKPPMPEDIGPDGKLPEVLPDVTGTMVPGPGGSATPPTPTRAPASTPTPTPTAKKTR